MSDAKEKCRWCEKAAEFLCDAILPGTEPAILRRGKTTIISKIQTCSAPMCGDHRKNVMAGMMDCSHKSGRRGGPGTGPFSVDHCPDHAARG
jgi:hypothetical protein